MADVTIKSTEEMVGSGHATKTDTLNRLALVEHDSSGMHKNHFQNSTAISNSTIVTAVSSATNVCVLNLGAVAVGDIVSIHGGFTMLKGTTAGKSGILILTDVLNTASISSVPMGNDRYQEANLTYTFNAGGLLNVTGAGNLIMDLNALSVGSNGTITTGNGTLQAIFLKKST